MRNTTYRVKYSPHIKACRNFLFFNWTPAVFSSWWKHYGTKVVTLAAVTSQRDISEFSRGFVFPTNPIWRRRDVVIVPLLPQANVVRLKLFRETKLVFMRAWETLLGIMLRSTGFFRGIDCPFYAEYSEGKGTKNGCNRPYCHFRHSQQSRPSYGTPVDAKKQRELQTTQKGANDFTIC